MQYVLFFDWSLSVGIFFIFLFLFLFVLWINNMKLELFSLYFYILFDFLTFFYFNLLKYFYCCSITVVPIFSPLLSPALPTPLPFIFNPSPPPIVFVPRSFRHVPWQTFPFFLPFPFPSGHDQFVLYFHVSGYILITCFVD